MANCEEDKHSSMDVHICSDTKMAKVEKYGRAKTVEGETGLSSQEPCGAKDDQKDIPLRTSNSAESKTST